MAVSFVGNGALAGYKARTSLSLERPAGVEKGDLLLMAVYLELTTATIASAGFSSLPTNGQVNQSTTYRHAVLCMIDSGAAGPYSVTWDGTSHGCEGRVTAYRGADQTTPINASSGQANASAKTIKCATLTTTKANCLLVAFGVESVVQSATAPSGFTGRYNNDAGEGFHQADALQVGAEASGEKSFTGMASNATSIGHLLAIAPAVEPRPGSLALLGVGR